MRQGNWRPGWRWCGPMQSIQAATDRFRRAGRLTAHWLDPGLRRERSRVVPDSGFGEARPYRLSALLVDSHDADATVRFVEDVSQRLEVTLPG